MVSAVAFAAKKRCMIFVIREAFKKWCQVKHQCGFINICIIYIWHNSINPTHTGLDRCQITELPDGTYSDLSSCR
jgi:hypothetical protein